MAKKEGGILGARKGARIRTWVLTVPFKLAQPFLREDVPSPGSFLFFVSVAGRGASPVLGGWFTFIFWAGLGDP